jgi:hypothetical protein
MGFYHLTSASCTLVFGVIPRKTTFQTQVINFGLVAEAISKGKISRKFPLTTHEGKSIFWVVVSTVAN